MSGNKTLSAAIRAKNDDFRTQFDDIRIELEHYKKHFYGKTVLCNCNDSIESGFFEYFLLNFNYLGLRKLVSTTYQGGLTG